jgi:hypothetical protein
MTVKVVEGLSNSWQCASCLSEDEATAAKKRKLDDQEEKMDTV